jgi:hypothetical protein
MPLVEYAINHELRASSSRLYQRTDAGRQQQLSSVVC